MQRAFSFPATAERSRSKERLEASLAGLCELELRKQRQECLVLGALALGDPRARDCARGEPATFNSWGKENLTLRRQLSALQSSPWGLMQALEQQVGELKIDTDNGSCDGAQGDTGESQPTTGFYEHSEGQSPRGRSLSIEATESPQRTSLAHTNDRPKSVGDPLNREWDGAFPYTTLPRSFSAPYPPLEGIAEEGTALNSWQWDRIWQQQPADAQITEEDYQLAMKVESYIQGVIQRYTLAARPCQPRTTLTPDPPYCTATGHRRTPCLSTEQRLPDPLLPPQPDLSANPKNQGWGCDLLEGKACGGEAPSLEEDCYLALACPQLRPHSMTERLSSPLPSLDPNCGVGALDPCCEPPSPQNYSHPQPQSIHHKHNLVSAHFIPGQGCHAPVRSPRHYNSEHPKPIRTPTSPDQANSKSRISKRNHNERQRAKKSSSKTSRSQSENSLLGQRVLPERRYSTTERHHGRGDPGQNHSQVTGSQLANSNHNGSRRWCSNLELSQDEGETHAGQVHRRQPRKTRHGHSYCHSQPQSYNRQQYTQHQHQHQHPDSQERAPLCQEEEGYAGAAPAESESSMSEVYSPASSSLSSDSDESGGLVWPQQLPPRLASTSSSSSPSPQTTANAGTQPKAFVKIKASHALKKKILRFRSGSLKVMTTV